MVKKSDLYKRKLQLRQEMKDLERQIDDLGADPYKNFAEEYESRFGKKLTANPNVFHNKLQPKRVALVNYLLDNKITVETPITVSELMTKVGIRSKDLHNILNKFTPLSPQAIGVVEVIPDSYIGIRLSKIYIKDFEKARTYLDMMEKMQGLPYLIE